MEMHMHDGLTRGFAHIHAQVKAVRMQVRFQFCTSLPNQFKRGFALVLCQIEEVGNMPKGNNQ